MSGTPTSLPLGFLAETIPEAQLWFCEWEIEILVVLVSNFNGQG